MENSKKAVVGFLVAPAVPALVLGIVNIVSGGDRLAWSLAIIVGVLSYVVAVALGCPVYLGFSRNKIHSPVAYVAAGAAIGLIAYFVMFLPQLLSSEGSIISFFLEMTKQSSGYALIGAGGGACSALVFWAIAIRSRKEP